ncbi:uncharacterized protein [Drosophila pseudoobscura]|uniref:Uncharacterized protein n=1 Tax=Drosophila pseudoobscura pseudoobscura TaxID=46245 RepID=A0A6I8VJS6_DROPS|nr:uncharacterized protein LOC6900951 [Drosophila pseudoobscura]
MPTKKKMKGNAKAGSIPVATATVVRRQMPPRACKTKSQSTARPSLTPSRQQPSRLATKPSLKPTTGSQAPSQTIAKSRPTGLETQQKRCLEVRNTLGERSTRHMMALRALRPTLDSVKPWDSDDESESVGVAPVAGPGVAPVAAPEVARAGGNAGTNQPAPFVRRTSRRLKSLPPF